MEMNDSILSGLNEQQKNAVLHKDGALLVIAGPGSGKTTILTRRISYLLTQTKNEKFKILALTFTTKAANEMKERVEKYVGEDIKRFFIGTFHSFCSDVLRKYGSYIGINNEFTIYEKESDYVQLFIEAIQDELSNEHSVHIQALRRLQDDQFLRSNANKLYSAISRMKSRLISPENIQQVGIEYKEELQVAYQLYNDKLRTNNAVDFADLLFLTYRLFKEKPFISKQYRSVYQYLMIDEAQDTNKAQFELIQTFCGSDYKNVFIVADEDQLIYEWNDARFEYLMQFVKKQDATVLQMFENYRCPREVLIAANRLIRLNINRFDDKKDLNANKLSEENTITITKYSNSIDESLGVVNYIEELEAFNDTCIIARNKYVLNVFEDQLKEQGIPYQLANTDERFSSSEVSMIIHLLQAAFNEEDKHHIRLICNYFGINSEDLMLLTEEGTFFMRLIKHLSLSNEGLSKKLILLINDKRNFNLYLDDIFFNITNLNAQDLQNENEEAANIVDDYKLLKELLRLYSREREEDEKNLGDFLAYVNLSPRSVGMGQGVSLLTGHAAKGLEYNFVFLVSLNQGVFPDYRAVKDQRQLEEERRNCFVAITRTKNKLFLSYTQKKNTKYRVIDHLPSQFIEEMGLELN